MNATAATRRAVWMNAWDLLGRNPDQLIEFLRAHGLNGCNLGLAYHGGRMLLANHPSRVVYQQPVSALYFQPGPLPLDVRVAAEEAALTQPFLQACRRHGFSAAAWLVLCHNDWLAERHPELAVTNAFGERYPYALCPAQPAVQDYCAELCRQAASLEGVDWLDLEALSFMGYEHQGLHEKRGLPLHSDVTHALSVCCCAVCEAGLPDGAPAGLRRLIRHGIANPYSHAAPHLDPSLDSAILHWRRRVQLRLLERIRQSAPGVKLNLRLAPAPRFSGGKCSLEMAALPGLADAVTLTFFGAPIDAMRRGLADLPNPRPIEIHGGFVFHEPDCRSAGDVAARLAALHSASLDGFGCYGFSMAAGAQWQWLQQAWKGMFET